MNEREITKLLYDRLVKDLDEISKDGIDRDEKKNLSEEIKAITTFLDNQDGKNIEWEQFLYQKERDIIEDKQKKVDRVFSLIDAGLRLSGAILMVVGTVATNKAWFMYETDRPITSQIGKMAYGKVMTPRI